MDGISDVFKRPNLVDPYFFPRKKISGNNSIKYYLKIVLPISIIFAIVLGLYKIFVKPGLDKENKENDLVVDINENTNYLEGNLDSKLKISSKNTSFLDDNIGNEEWSRLTMDPYVFSPHIFN